MSCRKTLLDLDSGIGFEQIFAKLSNGTTSTGEEKISSDRALNIYIDDLSINFKGNASSFSLDLKMDAHNGKAVLMENGKSGSGVAVFLFDTSFKQLDIRFDRLKLSLFKDIIKGKIFVEKFEGVVNGYADISRKGTIFDSKTDVSVKDLVIEHPLIDWQPFKISFMRFSGNSSGDIAKKVFRAENQSVSLGGIDASVDILYETDIKTASIKMSNVQLARLETLVHNDVFNGYLFEGTIDLSVSYTKENEDPPFFSVAGQVKDPAQRSTRLDYLLNPFKYTFTDRDGNEITFYVGGKNDDFVPLEMLPVHLVRAVVISEDAGFFKHNGIDFDELSAAVKDNIKKKKLRGGSTITQQIAKNLFLKREKTLLRKFREVLLAIELDAALSKNRLLEIYFNIIEWAPGVFGIAQASWHYFGKTPFDLTPLESAYLASVIPGPYKYHYQFLKGEVSDKWKDNLHRILSVMNDTGHLSITEYLDAVNSDLVFRQAN